MKRQKGFTLAEVMVAVIILATVLSTTLVMTSQYLRAARLVETRTLAGIVAGNRLAQTMAEPSSPDLGITQGTEQFAGQAFTWRQTVTPGPVDGLAFIDVQVSEEGELHPVARLTTLRRQK